MPDVSRRVRNGQDSAGDVRTIQLTGHFVTSLESATFSRLLLPWVVLRIDRTKEFGVDLQFRQRLAKSR